MVGSDSVCRSFGFASSMWRPQFSLVPARFRRDLRDLRVGTVSGMVPERIAPTLNSTPGVHATRSKTARSGKQPSIHVRSLCQRPARQARRTTCDASRIVTWGAARASGPQAPRLPAARLSPTAAHRAAVPPPTKAQALLRPDQTSPTSRDVSRTSKAFCHVPLL